MSSKQATERLTIRLPEEQLQRLNLIAAKTGAQSVSDVVRIALDEFLNTSHDKGSDRIDDVLSALDGMHAEICDLRNSMADSRLTRTLAGLIENFHLPMSPVDRKPPILSLLRMLKGE